MPRIAGIQSAGASHEGNEKLTRMLHASGARGWSVHCEQSGRASLGWCGGQTAGLARHDGLAIVLDGHIYNRNEIKDGASDAEVFLTLYRRHGFVDALRRV